MPTIYVQAYDNISISYPPSLTKIIRTLFPLAIAGNTYAVRIQFTIVENVADNYILYENGERLLSAPNQASCALALINEVVRSLAHHCEDQIAIHAGAVVKDGITMILPGNTGCGKTSMTAWLTSKGYDYLTDELVFLDPQRLTIDTVYRPLIIKTAGLAAAKSLIAVNDESKSTSFEEIATNEVTIISANEFGQISDHFKQLKAGVLILPNYQKDAELLIEPLTSAQAGLALMACNVNARNIKDHGFSTITHLSRQVSAIKITYSDFSQLDPVFEKLLDLLANGDIDSQFLRHLSRGTLPLISSNQSNRTIDRLDVSETSPLGLKKKLTIAMATYDDYDGVYFSAQSIRLYHPEVTEDTEILVLDNNPYGKCAQALKNLDTKIRNFRYVPIVDVKGTVVRDKAFEYANSENVLCIDCHVLIEHGAISRLINYFESHPATIDLLQGPMRSEDLIGLSTHFKPVWNKGMYGVWSFDERGTSIDAPAFKIPMQGLGLFAARKASWPGFNPQFRGFGGEEGYIHEKFRLAGGKTLCLPFLRWLHRFDRPMGVPYPINWSDRIRNYLLGFTELKLDTTELINHFKDHVGEDLTLRVVADYHHTLKQGK